MKPYQNANEIHKKFFPEKNLENFWRSKNYLLCEKILAANGIPARRIEQHPSPMTPSIVMIHPLIVFEFLRWGDPEAAYRLILKMVSKPKANRETD
jgi:hypothetical protein